MTGAKRVTARSVTDIPSGVKPTRLLTSQGYVELCWRVSPRLVVRAYEHRLIAGFPDPRVFDVHHRNKNRSDNRPENLEVVCKREHTRQHHLRFDPALAAELYRRGVNGQKLSAQFGVDPSNVTRALHRLGVKVRGHQGENNPAAKLSESDVLAILERLASGATARSVAREFKVSPSAIGRIRRGENWLSVGKREITPRIAMVGVGR